MRLDRVRVRGVCAWLANPNPSQGEARDVFTTYGLTVEAVREPVDGVVGSW